MTDLLIVDDHVLPMSSTGNFMITDQCQKVIDKLAGKTAIEMLILLTTHGEDSWPDRKRETLDYINGELETKYAIRHIDNWVAGRAETPKRVKIMARKAVFDALLDEKNAEKLADIIT